MKHALISKNEPVEQGYRVAQVQPAGEDFEISDAGDLFWIDVEDHIVADEYWYDPVTETLKEVPKVTVDSTAEARANEMIEELLKSIQ